MFSGIVECIGTLTSFFSTNNCLHMTIEPAINFDDIKIGDSIAVNGVCLTVTELLSNGFKVTLVPETLRLTNLGKLKENSKVNLERSITPTTRLGGHYVQGHVDDKGVITEIKDEGDALLLKIQIPAHLAKYIVNKGYIGMDGMSLTVIEAFEDAFTLTLIPHTREVTIAKEYRVGTAVNIEVDMMGKYIERLARPHLCKTI